MYNYGRNGANNPNNHLRDREQMIPVQPLMCRMYHKNGTDMVVDMATYHEAIGQGNYFNSPWEARAANDIDAAKKINEQMAKAKKA